VRAYGVVMSEQTTTPSSPETQGGTPCVDAEQPVPAKEIGGPKGPEPTRYGDWEVKGRCIDF
jgi:hypothetical protein